MRRSKKQKLLAFAVFGLVLALTAALGITDFCIPDRISIYQSGSLPEYIMFGIKLTDTQTQSTFLENTSLCKTQTSQASWLGMIPIKEIAVNTVSEKKILPGGTLFGVKLQTKGPVVIGFSESENGEKSPAEQAGLRPQDVITAVGETPILSAGAFSQALNQSAGETVVIHYEREGKAGSCNLTPLKRSNGAYHAGLLVRDSTAGIGTITFIDPQTGLFAGLGHGICDSDTGYLLPLGSADILDVELIGVQKGAAGTPGELRGSFTKQHIGALHENTNCGVFGILGKIPTYNDATLLPIGLRDDVKTGKAYILSSVDAAKTRNQYEIEIIKIIGGNDNKSFIIHVTDPTLLEKTGGIVQGMSGSPIIQDGKLVGAITHVLVNDPTKGYGIFIENMLAAEENEAA
ncbi:MAG: SpoIVB peptidase [Eubacteriales bacterium]|nr:SpoIVB peptidase [Eubacteriales bacterium]